MRLVVYLGTRGCRTALAEALDGYHDELVLVVPADPALLGPHLEEAGLEAGLAEIARILTDHALEHAARAALEQTAELADVFGEEPPSPEERISTHVVEGDLAEGLGALAAELAPTPGEAYIARDALDVLDGVGIRPSSVLDRQGVELVAR